MFGRREGAETRSGAVRLVVDFSGAESESESASELEDEAPDEDVESVSERPDELDNESEEAEARDTELE